MKKHNFVKISMMYILMCSSIYFMLEIPSITAQPEM